MLSVVLCGPASALTWHFNYVAGNDQAKKDQITAAMNEAVAIYNSSTNFKVDINVNYDPGIPTAQSDYNGTLGFGGSISTQVALHEIAHYLGSGTIGQWDANFDGGGVWTGTALRTLIKNYDGPGAEIRKSGVHYYPYGFNYGSEDSPDARRRLPKLIQAMRFDMGLQDSDGDGMSDEWELYRAGTLALDAAGDADGDRVSNRDEWLQDGDPLQPAPVQQGHTYLIRSRLSQKLMEAAGTDAGANVRQNAPSGSDLQKWTAFYIGGGYWKFLNYASGKALETGGLSNDDGANIQLWDDLGHDYQQWRLVGDSGAEWKIINKGSRSKVVDVEGGPGAVGNLVNISQYHDDIGANNQLWSFEDVTPGAATGPLLQAAYKLDNSARDSSGNEYHGVISGGVSYVAGRVDAQAASFNGVNGSISIPASVDMTFSISFWLKTNATAPLGQWFSGMGLVDAEVPGVATDFGIALLGGRIGFGMGNPDSTLLSANAVNDDQWHHVVATRDGVTGMLRLYIDNVMQASGTRASGPRMAPTAFRLGSIGGTTGFFRGALDEVRIYKGILGPEDIAKLSGAGRAQVAAYGFDGNTQDATLYRHHGRAENVTYTPGRTGNAAQFNGVNSFVKIPAAGLSDFSVSYWVKTTATGGLGQWFAGKAMVDGDMPGTASDWGIALVGSKAAFGTGNPDITIRSTSDINDGVWHHVAVTRTNAGAKKLFVDGVLQASGGGSPGALTAPGFLRVGASMYGGAFFDGAIDDLRLFNYALTPTQISSLASSLPDPWAAQDIGNPASDGMAGFASGLYTVAGSGSGISGSSDQFQFVSSPQTGSPDLIVRLLTPATLEDNTATGGAKAGLMFRASVQPDAPFVALVNSSGEGLQFLSRDAAATATAQTGSTVSVTTPCWLRLVRSGDDYSAFYAITTEQPASADWIPLGVHHASLGAAIPAGLIVTSQAPLRITVATFDNLSVATGASSPAETWRQQYFGTAANAGDAADDADPDHDGISNLLERALGLAPNVPNPPSALPTVMLEGENAVLNYTRSTTASDLSPQVQWSTDLSMWSASGVQGVLISSSEGIELRQGRVPRSQFGGGKAFLRLSVGQ